MPQPKDYDPLREFIEDSAAKVLKELKDSFLGSKSKRRAKKRIDKPKHATVVEVMVSGLEDRASRAEVEAGMKKLCKSQVIHDLAEFEILETKVVDRWLIILHFTFLSPLPPEAAKYETEVVLNNELDFFGLLAYKVDVHGS